MHTKNQLKQVKVYNFFHSCLASHALQLEALVEGLCVSRQLTSYRFYHISTR